MQRGERGYVSQGLVKGALEWAMTDVYNFIPFPSLLRKASALMYAYVCFHPFSDGNKRTSLMAASFFLSLNACQFDIPDGAPEFLRELAVRTVDNPNHEPVHEVNRVSEWMRKYTKRTFWDSFDYARKAKNALKRGLKGDVYLTEELMPHQLRFHWGLGAALYIGEFFHLTAHRSVLEALLFKSPFAE